MHKYSHLFVLSKAAAPRDNPFGRRSIFCDGIKVSWRPASCIARTHAVHGHGSTGSVTEPPRSLDTSFLLAYFPGNLGVKSWNRCAGRSQRPLIFHSCFRAPRERSQLLNIRALVAHPIGQPMYNAKAYSAANETSPLASTMIARRDPTRTDVQIEILFAESATPTFTRSATSGAA